MKWGSIIAKHQDVTAVKMDVTARQCSGHTTSTLHVLSAITECAELDTLKDFTLRQNTHKLIFEYSFSNDCKAQVDRIQLLGARATFASCGCRT